MKLQMAFRFTLFAFAAWSFVSVAEPASVIWSTRKSKVICGGIVDGQDLKMRVVVPNELLAGESVNGRILVYFDLHKPSQVRWVISDAVTDDQYAKREAALAKLAPDEAALLRKLTATRETDIYMGMTDGFVTMTTATRAGQSMGMSCQEIPL